MPMKVGKKNDQNTKT